MIIRKTFFTLLEMMVVLFILSLGIALTGVKITQLFKEQRFLSQTQQVVSQLTMAQDLMLIMDTDVKVTISQDRQTRMLTLALYVEKPLSDERAKLVERKLELDAFHSFQFNNQRKNPLVLNFSLGMMSKGALKFSEGRLGASQSSGNREFIIELPGYPEPIVGKVITQADKDLGLMRPKREKESEALSRQLFPTELIDELYKDKDKKPATL